MSPHSRLRRYYARRYYPLAQWMPTTVDTDPSIRAEYHHLLGLILHSRTSVIVQSNALAWWTIEYLLNDPSLAWSWMSDADHALSRDDPHYWIALLRASFARFLTGDYGRPLHLHYTN